MQTERRSLIDRIVRSIPIVGFAARCMEENRPVDLAILAMNVVLATLVAVSIWGYPALITAFLIFTAVIGTSIALAALG
ncbi:MAG: hypothetical protein AAF732_15090 [Pseudomonadota bacterium]